MPKRPYLPSAGRLLQSLLLATLPAVGGCGLLFGGSSPDTVNIQLRKDKDALKDRVAQLEAKLEADQRLIAGLQAARPTTQSLTDDRLANLFTCHGLKFGRLTGGWDRDPRVAGDEGVAVYIVPIDEDGQPIKAAGSFTIEAFDLADPSNPLIGTWKFNVAAARKTWRGAFLDYNYVLECAWQGGPPKHSELTLKVTFLDELTQVPFTAQQIVKVSLPPPVVPHAAVNENPK